MADFIDPFDTDVKPAKPGQAFVDPFEAPEASARPSVWKQIGQRWQPPPGASGIDLVRHWTHPSTTLFNVAGRVGEQIGERISEGIGAVWQTLPEDTRKETESRIMRNIQNHPLLSAGMNALKMGAEKWAEFSKQHPREAEDLENLVNTTMVTPFARSGVRAVKDIGKAGLEAIHPSPTPKGALGQIVQGKGERDLVKGVQALGIIDTEGVGTYKQLGERINAKIPELAAKVDQELAKDTIKYSLPDGTPVEILKRYGMDDLATTTTTAGGQKVTQNFVKQAIRDLRELYGKIADPTSAKEMAELSARAEKDGLTRKEVNDLARKYNVEFGEKAFSKKSGEALTSTNAEKFETIRKGLKDVSRRGLSPEAAAADADMAALYNTRRLVNKVEDGVTKLAQKIEKRGIGEKLGRAIGIGLDVITGGAAKGLIEKFIPRGVGNKVMNALDLEEKLGRNLKIVNRALAAKTDDEMIKILSGDLTSMEKRLPQQMESLPGKVVQKGSQIVKGERGSTGEMFTPKDAVPVMFKNTEDAIAYGQRATPEQVESLRQQLKLGYEDTAKRKEAAYAAMKNGDFGPINQLGKDTQKNALIREAIETAEGAPRYGGGGPKNPSPGSILDISKRLMGNQKGRLVMVEHLIEKRSNAPKENRVYQVSFQPKAVAGFQDKLAAKGITDLGMAREVNANPERVADWSKIYADAVKGSPLATFGAIKKVGENKLAGVPIVDLTQGCQRARTTAERIKNGVLPNETRIESCYGGDCWVNDQFNRKFKTFENMEVRDLKIADKDKIAVWMDNKANQKFLNSGDFIRMGQRGDDSHAIASGLAEEWFKQIRAHGINKKSIMISASYAPITAEQYAALVPYKDLMEIHFSNSGWFHKNEIMTRLGEYQAAKDAGLPAKIRLITNKDGISGMEMQNQKFIDEQLKKMKVPQEDILETPFHDDTLKRKKGKPQSRSAPTGKYKFICCESGKCSTCGVKCMTQVKAGIAAGASVATTGTILSEAGDQ